MTTNIPSRAQIDRAAPLDFPDRTPKQELTIMIRARFNGFDTEITFSGQIEQIEAITRRLLQLGAEAVTTRAEPTAGNGTARPPAVSYADDGTPCCGNRNCSRNGQPMETSQHGNGYFCKGKDTVSGNQKGYCKSRAD